MASLKSLLKDTAIYGISSIAGRFVNYLLVPIETYAWVAGGGQFGVITNVYSYIGILIIALTFGMETTFFRFANKEGENARMVYSTALRMVGAVALVFALLVLACLKPLAAAMGYADHVWYIGTMAVCVAVDAWTAIMFDYLRYQHKPWKFMALKLANILINVALVGAFLFVLPHFGLFIPGLYDANGTPDVGIVFYVNLFVSVVTVLLLSKEMTGVSYGFDKALCRRMLSYTWPMLILGIAGQLNQSASTIIFPYLFDGDIAEAHAQLGIYGATIKIAMIMVIITQAFRFAYEPFIFSQNRDSNKTQSYIDAMKYFIIFSMVIFLGVMFYLPILKYFIAPSYFEGLKVVPVVMLAELFFGIFFNLSLWYKLTDRTVWGMYFSLFGLAITVVVNVLLVPLIGYMGCAWGAFASYLCMMVASWYFGRKYYPIAYNYKNAAFYIVVAMLLYGIGNVLPLENTILLLAARTVLLLLFLGIIVKKETIPLPGIRRK